MRQTCVAAAALIAASPAWAFTPESGFWWNPSESGRGYSLEIQDNYLFLTAYVYDNAGTPVWFSAQGTVSVTDRNNNLAVYTGTLDRSANGQCIGCPYRAPTFQGGAAGNFRIDFQSETRAVLTWQGGTTPIQRFDYALTPPGGDPRTDAMLGEWQVVLDYSVVSGITGYPLFGDRLLFDRRSQDANEKYFDGCRTLAFGTRTCTAGQISAVGASGFHFTETQAGVTKDRLLIAVRNSNTDFLVYYLDYGTYQVNGLVKSCPTSIPAAQRYTNCILSNTYTAIPVRGLRTVSRSYVAGDNTAPNGGDLGKAQIERPLPTFSAAMGGFDNAQALQEMQLDWSSVPQAGFDTLMQRMQ